MKNLDSFVSRRLVFSGFGRGLTLLELTLTISIILGLIGILFTGSSIYEAHANRSSCIMAQDQMRKAIIASANMRGETLESGVDYFGTLEIPYYCPESGGIYTAIIDDASGELIITCIDHGDDHRHE